MGSLFAKSYKPEFDKFKVPHLGAMKDIPDHDLLSPCIFYKVLDMECRAFVTESTTIWATGKRGDCDQWKTAFENCDKWEESKDRDALEKVLILERSLFKLRQVDNVLNDVWKLRDSSPTGPEPLHFNAPLPQFLQNQGTQ